MEEQSSSSSKAEGRHSAGSCGDGEGSNYECNICLEVAHEEPVLTLCGHLFCYACIYRWLRLHLHSRSQYRCPVCKAHLPKLIPLSTRQQSSSQYYLCNPVQGSHNIPTAYGSPAPPPIANQEEFTATNTISAAPSGLLFLLLLGFHDEFACGDRRCNRVNGRANHEEDEEEELLVRRLFEFLAWFAFVCLISF